MKCRQRDEKPLANWQDIKCNAKANAGGWSVYDKPFYQSQDAVATASG